MNAIEKLFPVSQQERSFQLKVRRDAGTAAPGWVQPQFVECKKCGRRATRQVWTKNLYVCPNCGVHLPIGAYYRLSTILDHGTFKELNPDLAAILAKHLEPLGIDAVIAEGTESGGHVGEMTTMALVPQVVDAVHVPVIAAGGIADGRGLAAALALGACGVQVGTCLLASTECPIHENYKAALLKARDSDTIVTGRIGGTPVRVLKNRMSREYVRQEKAGADKMALERFTLGSLRKAVFDGDTENGSLMAGQAAGLLHEVRPVEEIFAAMVSEAKTCITGLYKETS